MDALIPLNRLRCARNSGATTSPAQCECTPLPVEMEGWKAPTFLGPFSFMPTNWSMNTHLFTVRPIQNSPHFLEPKVYGSVASPLMSTLRCARACLAAASQQAGSVGAHDGAM